MKKGFCGLLIVSLLVMGCQGFHLRGMQKNPLVVKQLAISPDEPTENFQRIFRKYLKEIGVQVVPANADVYVLRLQPERYVKEVLIIGTDAEAKQEELIYTLGFEIVSPGEGALGVQTIQVERMLNMNIDRILGQNQEEMVLLREMRQESASQLYYRLNIVADNRQTNPSP